MTDTFDWEPEITFDTYDQLPMIGFDPIVLQELEETEELDHLIEETLQQLPDQTSSEGPFAGLPGGVPGGAGTEDLVDFINGGNSDLAGTIDDVLTGEPSTGVEGTWSPDSDWAPPLPGLPGLPEEAWPGGVAIIDIIHPDEFTLNGFPYQGNDPRLPGYWNPPTT